MSKLATPRYLLAETTSDSGDLFAYLELTPKLAEYLDALRDAVAPLQMRVRESFYAVELFTSSVDYVRVGVETLDWHDLDREPAWRELPGPLRLEPAKTCAATVKAMSTGFAWSASHKHADDYFETPELHHWQLAMLLDGADPFERITLPEPT